MICTRLYVNNRVFKIEEVLWSTASMYFSLNKVSIDIKPKSNLILDIELCFASLLIFSLISTYGK